jgi:hypothetical protein
MIPVALALLLALVPVVAVVAPLVAFARRSDGGAEQ